MSIILEGSGTVTGITTFVTPLDDIKFDSISVTGIATAGTFQAGSGVSMASPRSQNLALYTNSSEWLTIDDAGNVGIGTTNSQIAADTNNAKVVNAGIVTANQYFGNQLTAVGSRVTGVGTFENGLNITGNITNGLNVSAGIATLAADVSIADKIVHTGDTNTAIRFPAADTITFETGGSERLRIDSSGRLLYGVNASISGVGFQFVNTYNQFYGVGNNADGTALDLVKTRATTASTNTVLQDADVIGEIKFRGSTSDQYVNGAVIKAIVNGTPGSGNDLPTDLAFRIMPDGVGSTNEALRIASDGRLLVGHTAAYGSSKTQIFNTAQYVLDLSTWSADANGPTVDFYKSRNATIGSATIVQSGDVVGRLRFLGNDGANARTAAQLTVESDGTPGTNDMPGRIVLATTADGASSPTERMRIDKDGAIWLNGNGSYNTDRQVFNADGTSGLVEATNELNIFQNKSSSGGLYIGYKDIANGGTITDYHFYDGTGTDTKANISCASLAVTAGNGIDFSAQTQSTSTTDDELLNHYEKGKWTPVVKKNDVANGTATVIHGRYVRVGKLCWLSMYARWNSGSNAQGTSGGWTIHGLPFALQDDNPGTCRIYQSAPAGYMMIDDTDYAYSDNPRWQINTSTYFDLYTATSSADQAWTTGMMIVGFTGAFMIHE